MFQIEENLIYKMDVDGANINADEFLPSKSKKADQNKAKKRTISSRTNDDDDNQMQVDDVSRIEGRAKTNMPKKKRKKASEVEVRKIAVPTHR